MKVSEYLAPLVKAEVQDTWPDNFFESVLGAWVRSRGLRN